MREDSEETVLHEPRGGRLDEGKEMLRGERRQKEWIGRKVVGQEDGAGDDFDEEAESGGEAEGAKESGHIGPRGEGEADKEGVLQGGAWRTEWSALHGAAQPKGREDDGGEEAESGAKERTPKRERAGGVRSEVRC